MPAPASPVAIIRPEPSPSGVRPANAAGRAVVAQWRHADPMLNAHCSMLDAQRSLLNAQRPLLNAQRLLLERRSQTPIDKHNSR